LKPVSVCFAVSLGDDEVGHCPADCLVARPAENARSTIIPIDHDAVRLHDNHCIKSGFQHQAQGILWRGRIWMRAHSLWRNTTLVRYRLSTLRFSRSATCSGPPSHVPPLGSGQGIVAKSD
jgi:hypothetical protein